MKIDIDPTVDCVFKALLGSEDNKDLLIHFLNAIMNLPKGEEIIGVHILNPFNEKSHLMGKKTVVDVKALDNKNNLYQIDIQGRIHRFMKERIVHNWATLLSRDLKKGEDYDRMRPVVSIWLMGQSLFPLLPDNLHRLQLSDSRTGAIILEKSGICLVELPKVRWDAPIANESERWQRFFVEGKDLDPDNLPDYMDTPEMEKAMDTLKSFHMKGSERAMHYFNEIQAHLVENTIANELADAKRDVEVAQENLRLEKEKALIEEKKARKAVAELKAFEAKAKETEAKAKETEAKAKETEAKAKETEAKAKETEAKAQAMAEKLRSLGLDPDAL